MNPRVAVITSGYLPVPNVLGGAVEALDMMMVQENEKTPNFDFTVFSSWAPGVDQIVGEGNFKYTDFARRIVAFIGQPSMCSTKRSS